MILVVYLTTTPTNMAAKTVPSLTPIRSLKTIKEITAAIVMLVISKMIFILLNWIFVLIDSASTNPSPGTIVVLEFTTRATPIPSMMTLRIENIQHSMYEFGDQDDTRSTVILVKKLNINAVGNCKRLTNLKSFLRTTYCSAMRRILKTSVVM